MKPILIIEDDDHKINALIEFVQKRFGDVEIYTATNLVKAVELVDENVYSLIFVDMAIPSHPFEANGDSPVSLLSGGSEVLLELSYLGRKDPCIVITQHQEIEISGHLFKTELSEKYIHEHLECKVEGCILYTPDDFKWLKELERIVDNNENINS